MTRRRRRRDVILDFTSLLDVTLIILFYFILFSRMDVQKAQEQANDAIAQAEEVSVSAEEKLADAERRAADAEALAAEAQKQLDALKAHDAQEAANLEALLAYGEGGAVKMRLTVSGSRWSCAVRLGGEEIAVLENGADNALLLIKALRDAGFSPEDTLLCELLYPADDPGSRAAYLGVSECMQDVKQVYPNLYISETDLSE